MKILLSFGAAIGVAAIVAYLVASHQKAAQFAREREILAAGWEAERAELEAALRAAKQRAPAARAAAAAEPGSGKTTAHEILERLKKLKVLGGDQRNASIRHIVHQLESLADLGPEALPAMREFLAKFEDVDYTTEPRDDSREIMPLPVSAAPSAARSLPNLDTILPPSLRLGLVQVLRDMGGEQAETILAEMLSTSGRGVEVAYVVKALQDMVPNKYRDVAITAAKDLLANPPAIDRPNRLDENAKNFLYGVLSLYNDPSFAKSAENLLITADGRVDRTALTYLTATLKEDSVPALYHAFNDQRVTNMWERAALVTQIVSYTGANQQANDALKEMVLNESLPQWLRATAIQSVASGRGGFLGGPAQADPVQLKARLEVLNNLPEIPDERLARAKTDAIQRIADQLAAGTEDQASGKSFRTRLGGQPAPAVEQAPEPR